MASDNMTIAIEFKAFDKFGKVTQKLNMQLKEIDKTSKKVTSSMDKMKSSAKKLNASLNRLAIVGFASLTLGMRKVIMVGAEFEQSIANLSALTGLGAMEMKFLGDSALEMGKAFGMSSSAVADGMTKVGSNMPVLLKQEKALKAVTETSIKMARISGMDVPAAATALTSSMNAFGLASKNASENMKNANEMLDSMAALAKAGPSPINEQALAMRESAAVANKMSINFKELGGMIQLVAEKNIRGTRAGRMLRNILLTIDKESGGRVKNYADLTEWIGNYGSKIDTTSDLLKEFTKRDIVATMALLENKGALEKYNKAAIDTGVANEQLAKVMSTTNMQWLKFKSTIQSFAIKVFQKHLQEPLKKVIGVMTRFVEWLDKGSAGARLFMSIVVGVGVGITALGVAFAAIKIGMFIKSVYLLSTAFLGLGTSLSIATGGLTLIIPLLAGVATWFLTAGNRAESAGDKVSKFSKRKRELAEVTKILNGQKTMWELLKLSILGASKASEEYAQIGMSEEEKAKAFIEKETGIKELGFGDKFARVMGNILDRAEIFYSPIGAKLGVASEESAQFDIIKAGERMQGRIATEERSKLLPRLVREYMAATASGQEARIVGTGLNQKVVVNISNENGKTKSVTTEGKIDLSVNETLNTGTVTQGTY